jgi:predicted TIM-barrel fold metal-dependent hydrolase
MTKPEDSEAWTEDRGPRPPTIFDVDMDELFLPDPSPEPLRYTVISVDDHLMEPPTTFEGRLPVRFEDRAPRVVDSSHGQQAWLFDGKLQYEWSDSCNSGRNEALVQRIPFRYEYLRPGCYEPAARVRDMDLNGVWASVNFPSFVAGFCGRMFFQCSDPELGLAVTRAWNDWFYEEWFQAYPDRFIPLGLAFLADPEAAANEIRRNAARGFRAVSLPESPHRIGLPSVCTEYWDPILRACAETETVVCLHIGSSGLPPHPPELSSTDLKYRALDDLLFPQSSLQACAEWVVSGYASRYPSMKIAMSEGGIGWVAMLIDRLAHCSRQALDTDYVWFDEPPIDVLHRNFWFCSLDDPSGASTRDVIGIDRIMLESDYPHKDSTWPHTQATIEKNWGHLPAEEIRAICCENAAGLFCHQLPDVVLPALR